MSMVATALMLSWDGDKKSLGITKGGRFLGMRISNVSGAITLFQKPDNVLKKSAIA